MKIQIAVVFAFAMNVAIFCNFLRSDSTTEWVQIGSGGETDTQDGENKGGHNQCGRMWESAYQFDTVQGRNAFWMGTSDGGLWKSIFNVDGTLTNYLPLTDNFPAGHTLGAFVVNRLDSKKILIGVGSPWNRSSSGLGIYRTTSEGTTWDPVNYLIATPSIISSMVEDRADVTGETVLASGYLKDPSGQKPIGGIWRSTDFGLNWTQVFFNGLVSDLIQDPAAPLQWYAGVVDQGVYYSADGGNNWCLMSKGLKGDENRILLSASTSRFLYALIIKEVTTSGKPQGALNGVYRISLDQNFSVCKLKKQSKWVKISKHIQNHLLNPLNQGNHAAAIAVDPANAAHVIFGLQEMAETFNATSAHVVWINGVDGGHHDYNDLLFRQGLNDVVISNDGGYYLYDYTNNTLDDSGNVEGINAFELTLSQNQGMLASSRTNPNVFMAGLQDNGITRGDISQEPALIYKGGGDGGQLSIDPDDPDLVAFSNTGGQAGNHFVSIDGGVNWNNISCGIGNSSYSTMLISPKSDPNLPSHRLFTYGQTTMTPANKDRVFVKNNEDTTCSWARLSMSDVPGRITHIDQTTDPFLGDVFVTVDSNFKLFSYNDSLALLNLTPPDISANPPAKPDTRANADRSPDQQDTIYYTTGSGRPSGAFISFNNGATWNNVTGDIVSHNDPDLNKLIANPHNTNELFLATNHGVFKSTDGGTTWNDFSTGLRLDETVQDIVINGGINPPTIYAATKGRGFWLRTIVDLPTVKP